jgi:hypothetical protein
MMIMVMRKRRSARRIVAAAVSASSDVCRTALVAAMLFALHGQVGRLHSSLVRREPPGSGMPPAFASGRVLLPKVSNNIRSSTAVSTTATAIVCHPTLLNGSSADPIQVLHWANYHRSLGFQKVFLWWSVPSGDNDKDEKGETQQPWPASPKARKAWETLRAVPYVRLTAMPDAVAHALGTDNFEVRCLRESARPGQWAALLNADQFLWLSSDLIVDANNGGGGGTTAMDRFLARYNAGGNQAPSALELSTRTYSVKYHDGRTNRSLFGGINRHAFEHVEDCAGPPRSTSVPEAVVLRRREKGARTGSEGHLAQAGGSRGARSKPSNGIIRLDPADVHVKEWPGLSAAFSSLQRQQSANMADAAERLPPPPIVKKEGSNCTIAYVHDSDLSGWVESVDESFRRRNDKRHASIEKQPTIYFVVTASLWVPPYQEGVADPEVRQQQYRRGIGSLVNATASGFPVPHKVVVVENNGRRRTPLDDIDGVSVLYTDNNQNTIYPWKGTKELLDVLACVEHFGMRDHDLVVKMTGRYYLDDSSHFMGLLRNLDWTTTQALIKFGPYLGPTNVPQDDCITGLIMLPVSAVRHINRTEQIIERAWAKAALTHVATSAVHAIQGSMGIHIAPGGAVDYFLV